MIIDSGISPRHISCTPWDLAHILFYFLNAAKLFPVLSQVHAMLGVDMADVAYLGCEMPAAGYAGEVGSTIPRSFSRGVSDGYFSFDWGTFG